MNDTSNGNGCFDGLPPIGLKKPDLRNVPPEVASRIVDMWRVESMLSDYAYRIRERDWLRERLDNAFAFAHEISTTDRTTADTLANLHELQMNSGFLSFARSYDAEAPSVAVNKWVCVGDDDCHRLGCETAIIYMHMALEMLPEDTKEAHRFPLIHCLRRLRNVVVHFKALDVLQQDFSAKAVGSVKRDGTPFKVHCKGSWFLDVKSEDIERTRGSISPEMSRWFQEQCKKCPTWWILQAAVEQLCRYFDDQET